MKRIAHAACLFVFALGLSAPAFANGRIPAAGQLVVSKDAPNVILLRYFVSWAVKLLGLLSGIGIIYRKEIFRKTAIVGSLFTILTAGLQHTYAEFHQYTQYMDQHLLNSIAVPVEGFTFSAITGLAVIMARVLDIFFAGLLIYFFTRPEVKKHFEP